ncbi:MAG: transposase [Dehalococcoidia bacterium]|nr:transposase [Dehalococcoidia bacterium]
MGRPPEGTQPAISREDIGKRNEVEGKFGTLKTRYSWDRVMAHLPETGKAVIAVAAFAMNLARMARLLLRLFKIRYFNLGFIRLTVA